jgi:hypothetical protein
LFAVSVTPTGWPVKVGEASGALRPRSAVREVTSDSAIGRVTEEVPAPRVARAVAASASSRTVRMKDESVVVAAVPDPVK